MQRIARRTTETREEVLVFDIAGMHPQLVPAGITDDASSERGGGERGPLNTL